MIINMQERLQLIKDFDKYKHKSTHGFIISTIMDVLAVVLLYIFKNKVLSMDGLSMNTNLTMQVILWVAFVGISIIIFLYWLNQWNEVHIKRIWAESKAQNMNITSDDVEILRTCVDHKLPKI